MNVLVSAYACEPGKGSEPGAGWNWAVAASRRHDVCVITRANNRAAIESELARDPNPSLRFIYVELPRWARFWKRGGRGVRLYYSLWQILAAREARRVCRKSEIDVVHHVTFANVWLPALACLTPAKFVLGPIAGGQRVPLRLYPVLGATGIATELLLRLRTLGRFNPLVRVAWRRAAIILANNEETRRCLPPRHRRKTWIRPNACVAASSTPCAATSGTTALYAGRLNRFKGLSLAIRALALAPEWDLVIIGRGPDLERLVRLARRVGVETRVQFLPPMPQPELWQRLAACRALLLPSLKEGASFIAVEAQALGVPVVAFDINGPAALAASPGARFELIRPDRPPEAIRSIAAALERIREQPPTPIQADFGLDAVARDVDAAYRASAPSTALSTEAVA
jgi:glycosyltransferase involved in cell wall biosynthesis